MKFSTAVIALVSASLAYAAEINVVVGKDAEGNPGLVFTPDQVTAKVGDRINFQFYPKNHTVTQSSFAEPCTRQINTATNELGVDSGFMAVAADATEIPVWTVEIMQDTAPIWMFCNQGNHCNSGMVFAVNAPTEGEKAFSTWKEKAATATHPPPEENVTAPFTPPAASSGSADAPTDSTAAPAPSDGSAAPAPSDGASAPGASSSGSAPAESSGAASQTSGTNTPTPAADQANANSPTESTTGGALSSFNVPGAGVALSLAGLVAGMLL